MSNTTTDGKISTLENLIVEQNRKLHRSVKLTMIIYIVFIIAMLAYTTIIGTMLQEATSPKAMAEQVSGLASAHLPQMRRQLVTRIDNDAEQLAKDTVTFMIAQIPEIEKRLKSALRDKANEAAKELETTSYETFMAFVGEHAEEVKTQLDGVPADQAAIAIADIFIEQIESELDLFMNDQLVFSLDELRDNLAKLAAPSEQLTQAEDAKRRVIMYWAWLNEKGEMGESTMEVLLEQIRSRYSWFHIPEELTQELDVDME